MGHLPGLECVWDDGSFDSADDPDTGSAGGCANQGGTWVDPDLFENAMLTNGQWNSNYGDWSSSANPYLAQNWATASATASAQPGSLWGLLTTTVPYYDPTDVPLSPSAQRYITAIARAAPTVCGGGVFLYGGPAVKNQAETAEGAFQGFYEWDSNSGFGSGAVAEGQIGPVGAGVLVQQGQPLDPFVFAGEGAGTIAFESGAVGVYAGTPYFGVGAYTNVTTNAGCQKGH
jgi:hypothetical protein